PSTRVLHNLFSKVSQYSELTNHSMRLNAFIFGLLNLRSLEFWFNHMYTHEDIIAAHYHPWGFLPLSQGACQPMFEELLLLLQPLSLLPFDLDLLFEPHQLQKGQEHLRRKEQLCSARHSLDQSARSTFQLMRGCGSLGAEAKPEGAGRDRFVLRREGTWPRIEGVGPKRQVQRSEGAGSESLEEGAGLILSAVRKNEGSRMEAGERSAERMKGVGGEDGERERRRERDGDSARLKSKQAGWWFQLMQSSQVYIDNSGEGSKFVKCEKRRKGGAEGRRQSHPPPREGVVEGAEASHEVNERSDRQRTRSSSSAGHGAGNGAFDQSGPRSRPPSEPSRASKGKLSWMGSPPESVLTELKRSKERQPDGQDVSGGAQGQSGAAADTSAQNLRWGRLFGAGNASRTEKPEQKSAKNQKSRLPSGWLSLDRSVLDLVVQSVGAGKRAEPHSVTAPSPDTQNTASPTQQDQTQEAPVRANAKREVRALCHHIATEAGHLSFHKGDVLQRMATHSYKVPPPFDEKSDYESWKNEIKIWKLVTELDQKKQALAVALSLTGRARTIALEISADDLNKDNGLTTLLQKLDTVYLKEEKDRQYDAYTEFDNIKRESNVTMMDYIVEFERVYNKMSKLKMKLPDAVLAFKLLDTAGLTVKDKQLALTACSDVTFSGMKSALKRIFGDNSPPDGANASCDPDCAYFTRFTGKKDKSSSQSQIPVLPGSNPLDKYGRRSRCAICQSTYHWAKDCPHKNEQAKLTENVESHTEDTDECHITLLSKETLSETEIFMVEALGSAVIDTACTRTVCGEKWLDNYVDGLKQSELEIQTSTKAFRFGDGRLVYSTKRVKIPAVIGQTECHIETEVVPVDIPLLLSKTSLKRAGAVLDIENDKATMFKQPVKLELTSSGHYCVNIKANNNSAENVIQNDEEVLTVTEKMTKQEKQKVLLKLHKQFGHASVEKLKKLLDQAGNHDDDCLAILNDIVSKCDTCIRYCRPKPKPAVGLPMASTYNETVAVDLHELEPGVWYLHVIDHFTRFSAGSIVTTKKPKDIVKHLIHCWISVHGPPHRLFSDNGVEFNNEEMRDMAEKFNIELKTTAAYSPWSNGLLERHNQTLTDILLKVKKENECSWSVALDWALMAKNSLHNVHGYSPYQLVFGQNPNMPSVLTDKPPALESLTMNTWMAQHITTLHAARRAFTEAECSERIKRALRKQLRANDDRYETGDKVYYKRADCPQWKGPGVVIGQEGVVVFVRHGGTYVRVHHTRLRKIDAQQTVLEDMDIQQEVTDKQTLPDSGFNHEDDDTDSGEQTNTHDLHDSENHAVATSFAPESRPNADTVQIETLTKHGHLRLKAGQTVTYTDRESGQTLTGTILGRAGKATGKHRNWYNVQFSGSEGLAGSTGSVNLGEMDNVQTVPAEHTVLCEESSTEDTLMVDDNIFDAAKQAELCNWKKNDVFEEVEDEGQKCISTREMRVIRLEDEWLRQVFLTHLNTSQPTREDTSTTATVSARHGIWDVEGLDLVDLTALGQIASVISVHASRPAPAAASGSGPPEDVQYAMAIRIKQNQCLQGSDPQGLESLKNDVNAFPLDGQNIYEGQTMVAARPEDRKHSEYRLLLEDGGRIIKKLLENKAGRNADDCVIFYTYNSPCLDTCLNEEKEKGKRKMDEKLINKGKAPTGVYRCIYPALDLFNTVSGPKAFVFTQLYRKDMNKQELSECLGKITEKIPLYHCDNNNRCRRCEQGNRYCTAQ
ncbi:hypothetical protein NFI96_002219, partial [Prochilodus magdalenae]